MAVKVSKNIVYVDIYYAFREVAKRDDYFTISEYRLLNLIDADTSYFLIGR